MTEICGIQNLDTSSHHIFIYIFALLWETEGKKNKYQSTQINETTLFLETEASDLEIYKYGFIRGPED